MYDRNGYTALTTPCLLENNPYTIHTTGGSFILGENLYSYTYMFCNSRYMYIIIYSSGWSSISGERLYSYTYMFCNSRYMYIIIYSSGWSSISGERFYSYSCFVTQSFCNWMYMYIYSRGECQDTEHFHLHKYINYSYIA